MIYEGTFEILDDTINIDLVPNKPQESNYRLQFDNNPYMIAQIIKSLNPFYSPDDKPTDTNEYISTLRQKGYGTFYSDSQNIHDLINLYATTPSAALNPFPGITTNRKSNEIVFIETISNFKGVINEQFVIGNKTQFIYKGEL